jgi:diacylglycerol kinase family enzyme
MRGLLLYNPLAGRKRDKREALVQQIAVILQDIGYDLEVVATTHRGSAAAQARAAIADGAEVVFACGGDGTVHDVLQGVAATTAALAIIPMGSANALARELKIPLRPIVAAHAFAHVDVIDVRLGHCVIGDKTHAFLVMAGAGPDGALMHRMLSVDRSRWGRWAYAGHAIRLLLSGRFEPFSVSYLANGQWCKASAVSVMAMRVGHLGGIFPGIARGASIRADTMRLVLVNGPAPVGLPLWFAMNWLGLERWNPLLLRADVTAFTCDGGDGPIHAQMDGEWSGQLPMNVVLAEETVRILSPRSALR